MSKPYALGIVPCTKTKNPAATTAQSLYRSGGFALTMKHAMQRCDRVIIMSARYGLLALTDPVRYYDATIAGLSRSEREDLIAHLRWQMPRYAFGQRTLSYLPKLYYETASEACPTIAEKWNRPYKHLGMLKLWAQLSKEIDDYKNDAGSRPVVPGVPRRRVTLRADEGS